MPFACPDGRPWSFPPQLHCSPTSYGPAPRILVGATPPNARLIAPLGGAVEPLVRAPQAVQSARIGGVRVIDDAVLEHERAHARPIARVRDRVGSAGGRELHDGLRERCRVHRVTTAPL